MMANRSDRELGQPSEWPRHHSLIKQCGTQFADTIRASSLLHDCINRPDRSLHPTNRNISHFALATREPSTEAILFGDVSPAGRLPMGMPRVAGQAPMTYAHLPTGRPANPDLSVDSTRYRDIDLGPLFPFGHGLSYATFEYSDLAIDPPRVAPDRAVRVSLTISNRGTVAADEVVQLYIRDPVASVARPVKELRGFVRITIEPGGSRRVIFELHPSQTAIWRERGWRIEAGRIDILVGSSSEDIRLSSAFEIVSEARVKAPAAALATSITVA